MDTLKNLLQTAENKEPAVLIASIGGFFVLLIELLPVFFPQIDGETVAALLKLAQAGISVATVLFVRSKVYAPATVDAIRSETHYN